MLLWTGSGVTLCFKYEVGSRSFQPDIQKSRQMENAARDI
jgi:hypothetical protein